MRTGIAVWSMLAGMKSLARLGTPNWWVRDANSTIWLVGGSKSLTSLISLSHFTQVHPYQRGIISRIGNPWSSVSGSPFMWVARKAPQLTIQSMGKTQAHPLVELNDGWECSS